MGRWTETRIDTDSILAPGLDVLGDFMAERKEAQEAEETKKKEAQAPADVAKARGEVIRLAEEWKPGDDMTALGELSSRMLQQNPHTKPYLQGLWDLYGQALSRRRMSGGQVAPADAAAAGLDLAQLPQKPYGPERPMPANADEAMPFGPPRPMPSGGGRGPYLSGKLIDLPPGHPAERGGEVSGLTPAARRKLEDQQNALLAGRNPADLSAEEQAQYARIEKVLTGDTLARGKNAIDGHNLDVFEAGFANATRDKRSNASAAQRDAERGAAQRDAMNNLEAGPIESVRAGVLGARERVAAAEKVRQHNADLDVALLGAGYSAPKPEYQTVGNRLVRLNQDGSVTEVVGSPPPKPKFELKEVGDDVYLFNPNDGSHKMLKNGGDMVASAEEFSLLAGVARDASLPQEERARAVHYMSSIIFADKDRAEAVNKLVKDEYLPGQNVLNVWNVALDGIREADARRARGEINDAEFRGIVKSKVDNATKQSRTSGRGTSVDKYFAQGLYSHEKGLVGTIMQAVKTLWSGGLTEANTALIIKQVESVANDVTREGKMFGKHIRPLVGRALDEFRLESRDGKKRPLTPSEKKLLVDDIMGAGARGETAGGGESDFGAIYDRLTGGN